MLVRLAHLDERTGSFVENFARFRVAVQIGTGDGCRLILDLLQRSRSDDFAPIFPGSRTDINQVIRCRHDGCVMFDDEHRIAFVPQRAQDRQEPGCIFWMQTDCRFIQDVDDTRQIRIEDSRQPQTLRFPSRQRHRLPVERQIAQSQLQHPFQFGLQIRHIDARQQLFRMRQICIKFADPIHETGQ